jgi:lipopolysaccharide exporter
LKGFSWNLAGNSARTIAGFIIGVLLARLLGPEPFGVVALAMVIVNIGNLIVESGLSSGLIQKKILEIEDISFVFTIQMVFGCSLALALIFFAPILGEIFKSPQAVPVIRILALLLVIQAFSQVSSAMLRRSFNFKKIQQAQLFSYLIGYLCIGIPLSLRGFGVWSLVIAQLVQSSINALMLYFPVHHSLKLSFTGPKELRLFGMRTLGSNIANWIIQNADNIIIGQAFGVINLGLYSRSYNLSITPANTFLISAQSVLLSASSRMEQHAQLKRVFLSIFTVFSIIFWPSYSILAFGAYDFIHLIYGAKWDMASPLLVPLALAMPLLILMGLQGPILSGLGKPEYELQVSWQSAIIAIVILFFASRISFLVTAWSILLIYVIRFYLMSRVTLRVLKIPWVELIKPLLIGVSIAGVMSLIWLLLGTYFLFINNLWVNMIVKVIIVGGVWLMIVLFTNKVLGMDLVPLIRRLIFNRGNTNEPN